MNVTRIAITATVAAAVVLFVVGVVGLISTGPVGVGSTHGLWFGIAGMFSSVVAGIAGLIRAATVDHTPAH